MQRAGYVLVRSNLLRHAQQRYRENLRQSGAEWINNVAQRRMSGNLRAHYIPKEEKLGCAEDLSHNVM